MKRTIAFGAAVLQGEWPVQEDGFFVDPVAGIVLLADGLGGPGAGDQAAQCILKEAHQGARSGQWRAESLLLKLGEWNGKLNSWNAQRAPGKRGACSALLASIDPFGWAWLANIGSSAALLVRAGALHTLLSPQAELPIGPSISRMPDQALGLAAEISPEMRSVQLLPDDVIVLVSGGVDWESGAFQMDLLSQLALRNKGAAFGALARQLVEVHGGPVGESANRSVILFEAL